MCVQFIKIPIFSLFQLCHNLILSLVHQNISLFSMSKFILSFSHTLFLDLHSTEFVRISSSSFVDSTIISFSRLCQNLILILCKFYHNLIFCQAYHILILFLFFSLVYQNPPLSFQYVKILLSHSSQLCQYLIPFLSLYSLLNFNLFSRSIFACIQR